MRGSGMTCSVQGCDRPVRSSGMCGPHYQAAWRERRKQEGVPCSVDDCGRLAVRRGLCDTHARRWAKTGQVGGPIIPQDWGDLENLAARIEERLGRTEVTDGGCWLWTGAVSSVGYAVMSVHDRNRAVHRLVYESRVGTIPEGMQIDHVCHTRDESCRGGTTCLHRRCVNPDHLELVTPAENTLRGRSPAAENARKTHCPQGHPYDDANTIVGRNGWRTCRACWREREVARRRKSARLGRWVAA